MNIETIKRKLLVKYPLFGSILAYSCLIEDNSIKTAGTDGKDIYYNPNFIASQTELEQIFLFAHAICHIAFDHVSRKEGKDQKLWNIATDAVINALLKQDGLPIIKGGVDKKEAIYYDAEEMYDRLLSKKKNSNKEGKNQNTMNTSSHRDHEDENDCNEMIGHDDHSMWGKEVNRKQENEQTNKGSKETVETEQEKQVKETIQKMKELGEQKVFHQNKVERKRRLEELREALASKSHGYGDMTNHDTINMTNIGTSLPLLDWRILLKETIQYDVDWSYQHAEIEDGVVTAHLEEMPRSETEIVLDTSGSIEETLLRNFLRECKNIVQTSHIKVGCFDTKFYGFTEIKDISDIDHMSFYGGGGTDFEVAVNAFSRRVENKIIFTDGDAPMPSTSIDAVWIVFGNRNIQPPGGRVIYINNAQLKRLSSLYIHDEKGRSK